MDFLKIPETVFSVPIPRSACYFFTIRDTTKNGFNCKGF